MYKLRATTTAMVEEDIELGMQEEGLDIEAEAVSSPTAAERSSAHQLDIGAEAEAEEDTAMRGTWREVGGTIHIQLTDTATATATATPDIEAIRAATVPVPAITATTIPTMQQSPLPISATIPASTATSQDTARQSAGTRHTTTTTAAAAAVPTTTQAAD